LKLTTSTKRWKKNNSAAQLKVQSLPEQKLKNAIGVSRFWEQNPDVKEKVRQKLIAKYQDPLFKARFMKSLGKNLHALSGKYYFDNRQWIQFGSSYELCFLIWLESQFGLKAIRRCKFSIPYKHNGKTHNYLPDYMIICTDGSSAIVEIKSTKYPFYDKHKNDNKTLAATEFVKTHNIDYYWFIDEDEGSMLDIQFKRSASIKPICKRLYNDNKLILNSRIKAIKYLGESFEGKKKDN